MPTKNIEAEKQAAQQFADRFGRPPENTVEQSLVAKFAYPTLDALPEEMRPGLDLSLWNAGPSGTPTQNPMNMTLEQLTKQSIGAAQAGFNTAQAQKQAAGAGLGAANPAMLGGAFAGIQKAIKAKTGSETAPLGRSSLFDAAGLKGFETLAQSLNQNLKDLGNKKVRLDNVLSEVGSQYRDVYQSARDAWDVAQAEYKDAAARLDNAMSSLIDHQRQIELIQMKTKADKELAAYQASLDRSTKGPTIEKIGDKIFQLLQDKDGNWVKKEITSVDQPGAEIFDDGPGTPRGILKELTDLKKDATGKAKATGRSQYAPWNILAGGAAASFRQKLETAKARITLPNLELLKGPMSDKDIQFIMNAGTSLSTQLGDKQFDEELNKLISTLGAGVLLKEAAVVGVKNLTRDEVEAAISEANGDVEAVRQAILSSVNAE